MAKQTKRERGYVPAKQAAASLRQIVNQIENYGPSRGLVKLSLNIWHAEDDQPELQNQPREKDLNGKEKD